ncbi:MAG TPA: hypothetical protein ENN73_03540 [Firmicutes bacterium]|nr:hypothetical protein [Bacillota bacterium]
MKRFSYSSIVILILFLLGCPKPIVREVQFEKSENLARSVIEAVKSEDIERYKGYYINSEDWDWIKDNSTYPEDKKNEITDKFKEDYLSEGINDFLKQIEYIKDDGIELSKIEVLNFEHNPSQENNLDIDDIIITFRFNDIEYGIKLWTCIKTDRGWVSAEGFEWLGRKHIFSSAHHLSKTVIESLTTNDINAYKQCLVSLQELDDILSISEQDAEKKEFKKENFKEQYWDVMLQSFKDIHEQGITDGIHWKETEVFEINLNTQEETPYKYTSSEIKVSDKSNYFKITIRALQSQGGFWFLSDPMIWGGKYK